MKSFLLQYEDTKTNWRFDDAALAEMLAELCASAARCQSEGPIPRCTVHAVETVESQRRNLVIVALKGEGVTR